MINDLFYSGVEHALNYVRFRAAMHPVWCMADDRYLG